MVAAIHAAADHFSTKRYIRGLVQGTEFDELDFIRQTSRIQVAELSCALESAAEELHQELNALVNDEFESFVKLFNDIASVGQDEFQDFQTKVEELHANAINENAKHESALLEKSIKKFEKNILQRKELGLSLKLAEDLCRLEKLLKMPTIPFPEPLDLEIATEIFLKLQFLVNAASGKITIAEQVMSRWAQLTAKFYSVLEESLLFCLQNNDWESWETIASIHMRISKTKALINPFISKILMNKLGKIVNKSRFEEVRRNCSDKATEILFNTLFEMIGKLFSCWFENLSKLYPNQDLFTECVLSPTFSQLTRELGIIFSPALPDVFHQNFTQNLIFLEKISTLVTNSDLQSLNSSEAFESYTRSWQLNVYFQLRFRDCAQVLEDSLKPFEKTLSIFKESFTPLRHGMLIVVEKTCDDLNSSRIVLKPLKPKFFRLLIQTISRASKWLLEQSSSPSSSSSPSTAKMDQQTTNEALLSKCWLSIWNHQELLKIAESIFSQDNNEMYKDLEQSKAISIANRFLSTLRSDLERAKHQLFKSISTFITTAPISSLQVNTESPLGLIESLKCVDTLQKYLPFDEKDLVPSLWKQVVDNFHEKSFEVINQSRKAVSNYRRLLSIVKEQPGNGEAQQDKEAQQALLFKAILAEVSSLTEFGKSLKLSGYYEEGISKLASLERELVAKSP